VSYDIANFISKDIGPGSEEMNVHAFNFGGVRYRGVQFTIGMHYCALNEEQVRDLIDALTKRMGER
jgi:hypothetical protein